MSWELHLALKYLSRSHRQGFISIVAWFSVIGITIGTAALIIVLAVMSGFETEVRDRIVGLDAHVRVRSYHDRGIQDPVALQEQLAGIPHVSGMSPYIIQKGMLRHAGRTEGAVLRGVDPLSLHEVLPLEDHILAGELDFEPGPDSDLPGVFLGKYLAASLGVIPGDTLLLISPVGIVSAFSQPVVKRFQLRAIFELGIYEFDDVIAFIDLQQAQSVFRMGQSVSGIEIRLDDINSAEMVKAEIENRLDYPYAAWTWFDMHKNLFSMMKLEKWMMFVMLGLIVLVAAFNIISTLTMMTMEKRRQIGILRAIGAKAGGIARLFIYQGLILGAGGTLTGAILGVSICLAQLKWKILSLPPDVYFISVFPVELRGWDIVVIITSALGISLLATLYPAIKAGRLHPVEAIRYEN
jgi:lipoprotein-releasing system permease protein